MLGQSKAQAPVPPVPPPPPREVCVVCAVSCGCFSLSKSEISKRFCQKSPRNLLSHLKIHDFWWIDRFQMCFIFFASWFKICGSFFFLWAWWFSWTILAESGVHWNFTGSIESYGEGHRTRRVFHRTTDFPNSPKLPQDLADPMAWPWLRKTCTSKFMILKQQLLKKLWCGRCVGWRMIQDQVKLCWKTVLPN